MLDMPLSLLVAGHMPSRGRPGWLAKPEMLVLQMALPWGVDRWGGGAAVWF